MKQAFRLAMFIALFALVLVGCGGTQDFQQPDSIARVPFGEPDFPNLGEYWIIDDAGVISEEIEQEVDEILEQTRIEGYAEQAIIVMEGVNNGQGYVIQMLRHLKLGNKEEPRTDNGLAWLVIIDQKADFRVWGAPGNGLPEVTAGAEYGPVIDQTNVFANVGDWDNTVLTIAKASRTMLQETYPFLQPTPTPTVTPEGPAVSDGGDESEEFNPTTVLIVIGIVVAIIIIGLVLMIIDPELGALWFEFWIRVLLAVLTKGSSSIGRSGSGSGRGSRGGR